MMRKSLSTYDGSASAYTWYSYKAFYSKAGLREIDLILGIQVSVEFNVCNEVLAIGIDNSVF